ncbi:MAG: DNA/RNA nuclease SfsA [Thermodesulfovibrio sp.]|nr:DNA/RNA nuclease SfsA [Thermodesulfovibrio sp.]
MKIEYPFLFRKIKGKFVNRLNRFEVLVEINKRKQRCYLPNSGKLIELLIPNKTELLLVKNKTQKNLRYTVLACYKNNKTLLLHTHLTNKIVSHLIKNNKIPFYRDLKVLKEEVRYEDCKFDLLLSDSDSKKIYLEVKTCTLFEGRIAMFPDAITLRGQKHLHKLYKLSNQQIKSSILFVIMNPYIKYFLPAYHIDLEFAKLLLKIKNKVDIKAICIDWDSSFSFVTNIREVKIPFEFIEKELYDRGSYLLVIGLAKNIELNIGSLGSLRFRKGYYIYVGSAKRGLSKRIKRHKRKLKKFRWHIDYLLKEAQIIQDFPIITSLHVECDIAKKLEEISDEVLENFGCSDCSCKTHLFYLRDNPTNNEKFINLVNFFRIKMLEKLLIGNDEI